MSNSSLFNLDECSLSNDLWPDFINKIGVFKASLAVRQALDLQRMQGNSSTLPVLIMETCGTCLLYTSPSPRDGLLSRMPSSA